MKKILSTLLILLSVSHCFAQYLEVISVVAKPMDIYGRVNEKHDLNGNKCAVLKILVDDDIVDVSGKIGNVISQGIEKSIYITQDTKKIKIKFAKHPPVIIDIKEYGINKLIGGCAYEIYLKNEEEKKFDTVEKSTGIIPEWINDVKEGQFVGISMPNNNATAAKKQALAMATLQYFLYNGGAKVKNIFDTGLTQITKGSLKDSTTFREEYQGTSVYKSSAQYSNFSVFIARDYYNINGEYFVLCDYLKDYKSKNTIEITETGVLQKKALEDGNKLTFVDLSSDLYSNIKYYINGVRCDIMSVRKFSELYNEDYTRIDGELVFNNGYKYPDFSISKGYKEQTFYDRLDLSSNSIGYSQLCFVMSIPIISKYYNAKYINTSSYTTSDNNFERYISPTFCITNKDSISVPIKIKWGGISKNKCYYTNLAEWGAIEQDLTESVCQYSLDSNLPSLIMSKHFSFIESVENLVLCLLTKTDNAKPHKIAKDENYIFDESVFGFSIKKIHLFPLYTIKDKKFNSKFNGVVVSSNEKMPFNFKNVRNYNWENKKNLHSFSPMKVFPINNNCFEITSKLKPSGLAHQILIFKGKTNVGIKKKVIEMHGMEVINNNKSIISSTFLTDNSL